MNPKKKVAVIEGIPRGKATFDMNPSEAALKRVQNARKTRWFYSPVGVVGYPGSGRKTLAYRFQCKNRRPFTEEVPVYRVYGYDHFKKFVSEDEEGKEVREGFRFLVKFYIIDPMYMCPRHPPRRLREWNEFSCMVIVFDINDKKTFKAVPQYMNVLRRYSFNIQDNFYIIGNKSDLRSHEARYTQVSLRSARRMADILGARYHECSAKQGENITPLLERIKSHGMRVRYLENYNELLADPSS